MENRFLNSVWADNLIKSTRRQRVQSRNALGNRVKSRLPKPMRPRRQKTTNRYRNEMGGCSPAWQGLALSPCDDLVMNALFFQPRTVMLLVLFATWLSAAFAAESGSSAPLPLELEQAFAVLDKMLPPKESFDMKKAPPNGEVVNPDGSHYTFNPMLYVPSLRDSDLPADFILRLAKNHPRVITGATMKSLPKEGPFRRVLDGRSYLPWAYAIDSIRQTGPTTAEALITTGGVGAGAKHRVLLELTAGRWKVKERKILVHYD